MLKKAANGRKRLARAAQPVESISEGTGSAQRGKTPAQRFFQHVQDLRRWSSLLRPGDWLVVVLGLLGIALSLPLIWQGGGAEKAVIRLDGRPYAEYPLDRPRRVTVPGPLGPTVIEIAPGRARVASDPSPRQYCVRQGWLTRAPAIAICAPNHVSLALVGRKSSHDSLSY